MDPIQRKDDPADQGGVLEVSGHLEAYENLKRECSRYAVLLENVEKERGSVQPHIYEKVRAEYERRRSALEEKCGKEEALLRERLAALVRRKEALSGSAREARDRLEELEFRIRVGELEEEEWKEEMGRIRQRAVEQADTLALLEAVVGRYRKLGLVSSPAGAPVPERPAHVEAPQGVETGAETGGAEVSDAGEASPGSPVATETGAGEESAADFEVVEEAEEDGNAPVVHCPVRLASAAPSKPEEGASRDRSASKAANDPGAFVTGYLVALEGSRQGERFPMISSNITLGNSPGIDIRLSDPGISSFHARILYKDRKHYLENLDTNGRSFVNGVQATDVVELKDGDVIRLGDIKMQVEYAPAVAAHAS